MALSLLILQLPAPSLYFFLGGGIRPEDLQELVPSFGKGLNSSCWGFVVSTRWFLNELLKVSRK